ncbi:hypothetical protein J1605_017249 [Eschrichtius robustus]|uniref:Uncharacterized protein n=1 Tax=Eschrichtius robustus TaxID=9764 RepID=A0AB34HZC8_ESCRO|nr:hypothetical protein J1605_017249 [Eschrichtius robustus]
MGSLTLPSWMHSSETSPLG